MVSKQEICVVWMDATQAKLVELSEERMKRETFRPDKDAETRIFWERIISHFNHPTRILILGPDQMKDQFRSFLLAERPELEKTVASTIQENSPSDQQIAEYAAKLWKPGRFVY